MLPNEYEMREHQRELLRQAEQRRFARQAAASFSLTQRAGSHLLRLGATLATRETSECYTLDAGGQTVTVCPA
jgi:hypothetical protein